MNPFETAYRIVLAQEVPFGSKDGGLNTVSDDDGGTTKWGISSAYHPGIDIAHLSEADAFAIAEHDYWKPCRCSELPWPVALVMFDAAFNAGPKDAVKFLQKALRITVDGVIGNETMKAVWEGISAEVICLFQAERLYAASQDPDWIKFGRGWLRRNNRVVLQAMGVGA